MRLTLRGYSYFANDFFGRISEIEFRLREHLMRETAITVQQCFISCHSRSNTHTQALYETGHTCTSTSAPRATVTWHASVAASAQQGRREWNGRHGRWVQRRRSDGGHDRCAERGGDEGGGERSGVHAGGAVAAALGLTL